MRTAAFLRKIILTLVWVFFIAQGLPAQPLRDRILGDVDISRTSQGVAINVSFTFPVRYVKHFPHDRSDELRIKLKPITISRTDREALSNRESVTPPPDNFGDLLEVTYEGDMEGGPFLSLFFNHPVTYTVKQGSDFRSVDIFISLPEDSPTGPSDTKNRDSK